MTESRPLALVTGASSGIGLELAKQFAGNGFDLIVNAEDAGLARTAQELRGTGATVAEVQADLRTAEGVDAVWAAVGATGLKDSGVTITSLMPGPTETNFFHRADMDDTKVGASSKDSAAQVAEQGFTALMKGEKKLVAGGFGTKAQGVASKVLPDSVKGVMHRNMAEPGSGD